jgi:hypothetical protein
VSGHTCSPTAAQHCTVPSCALLGGADIRGTARNRACRWADVGARRVQAHRLLNWPKVLMGQASSCFAVVASVYGSNNLGGGRDRE